MVWYKAASGDSVQPDYKDTTSRKSGIISEKILRLLSRRWTVAK